MNEKIFYVTTPIYYVNGEPHLGHFYCTIAADIIANYFRQQNKEVLFLTGTDEHGQKAEKAAKEKNQAIQEYVDEMANIWKNLWKELNISNDDFIRTTEERHLKTVSELAEKLYQKGDIYAGHYQGWYCTPCETFWLESQLLEGKICPNEWCRRETNWVREDGYYFALSKYQELLLKYYEENPKFILPRSRYNEVVRFVQSGLQDVYVTRSNTTWGVAIPWDKNKILYVWFDALINYLTAAKYPRSNYELGIKNEELEKQELRDKRQKSEDNLKFKIHDPRLLVCARKFKNIWPADVHLIGKDILRFHAVIWPAMLLAAELKLPKCILTHGFWNISGEKMSKSKGIVFTPLQIVEDLANHYSIDKNIAVDVLRYFLIAEATFGLDGNFSIEALHRRYEYDLANDLGNLVSRILTLREKTNYKLQITNYKLNIENNKYLKIISEEKNKLNKTIEILMQDYALTEVITNIFTFVKKINGLIEQWAPWKVFKENKEEALKIVSALVESLTIIAELLKPFMPNVSANIVEQIRNNKKEIIFPKVKRQKIEDRKQKIEEVTVMASKAKQSHITKKQQTKEEIQKPESNRQGDELTIDDFKKIKLVVGEILEAENIKNSDKLLKLKVDIGSEVRQLVAGIAQYYKPEVLIHKKVIVLINLKPAKLRGEISQGMLLAASNKDKKNIYLLVPDGNIENGSVVS